MLFHRVSPGEYSFTSSDGNPGTNGVILKTRCGLAINNSPAFLQVRKCSIGILPMGHRLEARATLALDHVVRQLICAGRSFGKNGPRARGRPHGLLQPGRG
jgi:hypothetical protein